MKVNVLKTYVEVTFEGENKLLKFDYNAVADVEERFGKGIGMVFTEENVGFNVIRIFYWAGLKWKQPGLTVPAVGIMLGKKIAEEGVSLEDLMEPVMRALRLSKLLGDDKAEGEQAQAESGESGN